MGQRTQIIIVHDVVNPKKDVLSFRSVTAYHNQWGFGRPVCIDIIGFYLKCLTGIKLDPYMFRNDQFDKQKVIDASYQLRTPLTHLYPIKDVDEVNNYTKVLSKKDMDVPAMEFVKLFDYFDNNNGGALIWAVDYCIDGSLCNQKQLVKYGCLLGGEETDNPFSAFIDGETYMNTVNPADYVKAFFPLWRECVKELDMRVLKETDTTLSIIEEIKGGKSNYD